MLQARHIHKSFDGQPVLRGVSLEASEGEIVALLGPSGCGKTTFLRIIAGLEQPEHGQLLLNGADLTSIAIHKRGFGMVFQDYALFPHRNVRQNVAFGLRMLGLEQESIEHRVRQVLELVGLSAFGARAVYELSGGEQQRVALARALAPWPRVLLLDEPLGSLDRALRERLMGDLRDILKRATEPTGSPSRAELVPQTKDAYDGVIRGSEVMTSIYVTHDQEEAFAIADRIIVMNAGQVEQEGTPVGLYRRPETVFVARFLGMENLLAAELTDVEPPLVHCALGQLLIATAAGNDRGPVTLLLRPEAAHPVAQDAEGTNIIKARVVDVSFRGRHQIAVVEVPVGEESVRLKFNFDSTVKLPAAPASIQLRLDSAQLRLLNG
ncbi:MAG: ABC transporter ATP-binding protein [Chloroflexota bacterium]|jgi:ABC-type Fe3+/spermidine/putrescine transport system ATPase subunit